MITYKEYQRKSFNRLAIITAIFIIIGSIYYIRKPIPGAAYVKTGNNTPYGEVNLTLDKPYFFKTTELVELNIDGLVYKMEYKAKTKTPNVYGAMVIEAHGLEKTKYLLRYKIKAQDASQGLFVTTDRDWTTRHQSDSGTYDWRVNSFEFVPNSPDIKVVFVLEAPGTVWLDETTIEIKKL